MKYKNLKFYIKILWTVVKNRVIGCQICLKKGSWYRQTIPANIWEWIIVQAKSKYSKNVFITVINTSWLPTPNLRWYIIWYQTQIIQYHLSTAGFNEANYRYIISYKIIAQYYIQNMLWEILYSVLGANSRTWHQYSPCIPLQTDIRWYQSSFSWYWSPLAEK